MLVCLPRRPSEQREHFPIRTENNLRSLIIAEIIGIFTFMSFKRLRDSVAIARRYVTGMHMCQRNMYCMLPAQTYRLSNRGFPADRLLMDSET